MPLCCALVVAHPLAAHSLVVGGAPSDRPSLTWGRADPYVLAGLALAAAGATLAPAPDPSGLPRGTLLPGDLLQDGPFRYPLDVDRRWYGVSNALLYGSLLGAVAATPIEYAGAGAVGRDLGRAGIAVEAVGTTYALTELGKKVFHRARPYTALDPDALAAANPHGAALAEGYSAVDGAWVDPDAVYSFPSGHTATVAAGAFGFTTITLLSLPDRHPVDDLWYAVPTAITAVTGYARVRASMHNPTDVLAGGLLGAACGVLIPVAHLRRPRAPNLPVVAVDADGLWISGVW